MASDGNPGKIPATSLVQGSQAVAAVKASSAAGKFVPPSGKNVSPRPQAVQQAQPARQAATRSSDAQSLVQLLNKYLNDSGRPDQYRVDPSSDNKLIQEINPATGEVIGEFSADEFPALARSVGASGVLVDSIA